MRQKDELDRLVSDAFDKREVYDMHRSRNIYGMTHEEAKQAYVEMERARAEMQKAIRAVNDHIDSLADSPANCEGK